MDIGRTFTSILVREWAPIAAAFLMALFAAVYVPSFEVTNAPDYPDIEGHDYMSFHAAGRLVLAGRAPAAYDRQAHTAMQRQAAREAKGGDGYRDAYWFAYPPVYLTVVTPFAALPYYLSFYAWMAATIALYLAALWAILPGWRTLLVGLAFPGAFCTFLFGQNAFLTAGMLGLALALLDRRPVTAGLLIGALCFKPQLGLALPVVLIASGRWRTFWAAAAGVAATVALSMALFGLDTWRAFFAASTANRDELLENSQVGFGKIETVFAALRWAGVDVASAYAAQGLVAFAVAAFLWRLWRSQAPHALKAAAVLAGTILMTPFALPYDLMVEAPAIAFLVAHGLRTGFRPGEIPLLGAVAVTPAVSTLAFEGTAHLAGLGGLLVLFAWTLARAAPWMRGLAPEATVAQAAGGETAPARRA